MENAAKRAVVMWLAKADAPVEGSSKGWSNGPAGSRVSVSMYTICYKEECWEGIACKGVEQFKQISLVSFGDAYVMG